MSNKPTESFVSASSIAAELAAVKYISSDLHLSTLNAKIMTARSGDIGKTFQPLTDYAAKLANESGKMVEDLSKVAFTLTKNSVELMQAKKKEESFLLALKRHKSKNPSAKELEELNLKISHEMRDQSSRFITSTRDLSSSIAQLNMQVKSTFYLSMNCRIEASRCNQFRADFESIATDIEQAAQRVQDIVSQCQSRIQHEIIERN